MFTGLFIGIYYKSELNGLFQQFQIFQIFYKTSLFTVHFHLTCVWILKDHNSTFCSKVKQKKKQIVMKRF